MWAHSVSERNALLRSAAICPKHKAGTFDQKRLLRPIGSDSCGSASAFCRGSGNDRLR
jgi:hypothetical protein